MINITAIWLANHAHLRPDSKHLPLSSNQLHDCSECGGTMAFQVIANVELQGEIWLDSVKILYCPACEQFMVDPEEFASLSINGKVAVTSVDARLWSPLPTFLNVEPTTRCNFRCWYCIGRHMEQKDITVEDFEKILENSSGVKTIALVGEGEPLLHTDFFTMARMASAENMKVVLISNGSLLNDENVKKLCESGVVAISISLDSTDPEQFSRSRVNGNLDKVLQGISRLRTFRDKHGFRYPKISVKGTLLDYSEHEMLGIVEMARDSGAEIFESFQPLNKKYSYVAIYPESQKGQLETVPQVSQTIVRDSEQARQILQPVGEFLEEEGIDFGSPGRINQLRNNCNEQGMYSLLSGDITPCCQVKKIVDPEWNLIKHPLSEIFCNQSYENLRFNLWNGLFPEYCAGCGKIP